MRGHEPRVEPRALQRVDAGLQLVHGLDRAHPGRAPRSTRASTDIRTTTSADSEVDSGVDDGGEREGGHLSMIEHTFEYGNLHRHSPGVS
ncbi:hypothetical protein GCM10009766_01380 [Microcella frigidaquae]